MKVDSYLVHRARSDCHDCGLQHLALGLLWQHDATFCDGLRNKTLDQHTIKQGKELSEGLLRNRGGKNNVVNFPNWFQATP